MKNNLKKYLYIVSLGCVVVLSGCSLFTVYRIDIPQGTPLTQEQAAKVKVGMTVEQVKYLLGSPAVVDGLSQRQWNYIYDFTPGTYGKQDNIPATHKQQNMRIYFSPNGRVQKIEGLATIPEKQYSIPSVVNKRLYED